jgi:hypothetical protein
MKDNAVARQGGGGQCVASRRQRTRQGGVGACTRQAYLLRRRNSIRSRQSSFNCLQGNKAGKFRDCW